MIFLYKFLLIIYELLLVVRIELRKIDNKFLHNQKKNELILPVCVNRCQRCLRFCCRRFRCFFVILSVVMKMNFDVGLYAIRVSSLRIVINATLFQRIFPKKSTSDSKSNNDKADKKLEKSDNRKFPSIFEHDWNLKILKSWKIT